jgi:DNA-binding MarR family transcriptional regulator
METQMNVELPANCTCLNLRKAARAVTQLYDDALKPCDLRSTQFSLLSAVHHKGPIGIAALASILETDRTTLTRNLNPLLSRSLIEITSGKDARRKPVALTVEGIELLKRASPLWNSVQRKLVEKIGQPRWESLLTDLTTTTTAAHDL